MPQDNAIRIPRAPQSGIERTIGTIIVAGALNIALLVLKDFVNPEGGRIS